MALLLCIYLNSHLAGTYKCAFLPKIDDYGFRKYDIIAYHQTGLEALNKVDLILKQNID